jgi:hypothetical protein
MTPLNRLRVGLVLTAVWVGMALVIAQEIAPSRTRPLWIALQAVIAFAVLTVLR